MSPIFLVDMHGLLLRKVKKVRQLLTNSFQKFLEEPNHKSNKILVDKGSEVYNWSMKSWLLNNDIEMYSAHNEEKFVVAEGFIRSLKTKFTNMWLQYPETCIDNIGRYSTHMTLSPLVTSRMTVDFKKTCQMIQLVSVWKNSTMGISSAARIDC